MEGLSEHDRAVVKTIFDNSETTFNEIADKTHENLGIEEHVEDKGLDIAVLNIVKKAITFAEANHFEECFRLFDDALRQAPNSPSILNDKAQALRLAGRDEEALENLHLAVKLSKGKTKAGIQALCQRGILYRCMNMDREAKNDFELAAKGGSDFAQAQLVALDPYAAMGNAVLLEITKNSGHS